MRGRLQALQLWPLALRGGHVWRCGVTQGGAVLGCNFVIRFLTFAKDLIEVQTRKETFHSLTGP